MSAAYPSGVDAFLRGQVDAETDPLLLQPCGEFAFDPAHATAADIGAALGPPVALTVDHVAGGAIYANPTTVDVPDGEGHALAFVLYADVGDQPLLSYLDRRADLVPIDLEPGEGYTLVWVDPVLQL